MPVLVPLVLGAFSAGLAVSVPAGVGLDEPDASALPAVPTVPVVPVLSLGVVVPLEELVLPEEYPELPGMEEPEDEPMLGSVVLVPLEPPVDCLSCIVPHAASDAAHATSAIHLDIDITFSLKINDAASYCLRPQIVNCG